MKLLMAEGPSSQSQKVSESSKTRTLRKGHGNPGFRIYIACVTKGKARLVQHICSWEAWEYGHISRAKALHADGSNRTPRFEAPLSNPGTVSRDFYWPGYGILPVSV